MRTQAFIGVALVLLAFATPCTAQRIAIQTPDQNARAALTVDDPDAKVRTLGRPEIVFDLSAGNDSLLDLRIRRSGLKLASGRPFTAFAGHKGEDLVVVAGGNVASVSIAGIVAKGAEREALVLFRRADGSIVAPAPEEVAIFNTAFKRLNFSYDWTLVPDGTPLPVSILLDVSGSMSGQIGQVVAATRDFLAALPPFARCRVMVFNETVTELSDPARITPCAQAARVLSKVPAPAGGTALFEALRVSFERNRSARYSWESGMPNITLVITDGIDSGITDAYGARVAALTASNQKLEGDNKLFVFWAGNADPSVLAPVADLQITASADVKGELDRFFRAFGVSLSGLQVLRIAGR
ncbi:MAG: VWA domain-containing protein [Blastocatellales bacterium]